MRLKSRQDIEIKKQEIGIVNTYVLDFFDEIRICVNSRSQYFVI